MLSAVPLPAQEYLKECFDYDSDTGLVKWKSRPLNHFESKRAFKRWNTRYAHTFAFNRKNKYGYCVGTLLGRVWTAHRIIYKLVFGSDPEHIDHVNGLRSDNRLCNIESVSHKINMKNKKKQINNGSGVSGVRWEEHARQWKVMIGNQYVGYYRSLEEAKTVRQQKEIELGFHKNHGKK